jgi:hypothetical protein
MAKKSTPQEEGKSVALKFTAKNRQEWMNLITKAARDHWLSLRIQIRFVDKLMGGQPSRLDHTEAMIAARSRKAKIEPPVEPVIIDTPEKREEFMEEAAQAGICEFRRREGKPGIWFPCNNIKAMLKENWSVLGYGQDMRGSKGALAEGVFVYGGNEVKENMEELDWIYLADQVDGLEESIVQAMTPQGPRSSLKRNEFVTKKIMIFYVFIANSVIHKLDQEAFAKVLYHSSTHGLGADRSQGNGKFEILSVEACENKLWEYLEKQYKINEAV